MKTVRIGLIGGTGFSSLIKDGEKIRVGTPYGPAPIITIGSFGGKDVAFLPRHGEKHAFPPHKINFRANMRALHDLGVERILATHAVGAINIKYSIGDIVIPIDFIDFSRSRTPTYYDEAPVTHIDLSTPYCPELRELLFNAAKKEGETVWNESIYLCTEGPRYETPAEIRMFRRLGCDIVGMTGIPELILARELEMCYASMCFVTNMAAGLQKQVTAELIAEVSRNSFAPLQKVLKETVQNIRWKRNCFCLKTLEGTRV